MTLDGRDDLRRQARELTDVAEDARALAERLGLSPVPVNYWLVDYDEMNALIAYEGFQTRYPHWRWGMQYDRQRKTDQYGAARAFEIVVNDEPAHAFLQESNSSADQKAVITHVEAHADFFANNRWYGLFAERVDAAAMLERHARRIESYMADPEIGRETVERWIDSVLPLLDTIDQHRPFEEAVTGTTDDGTTGEPSPLADLSVSDDVKRAVFEDEWFESDGDQGSGEKPVKDVLSYLRAHGRQYDEEEGKAVPMAAWRQDVIDMLRAESYYFAPQKMTRVMNEGWACVTPDTRVFTDEGLVPMKDVVENHPAVSDGETTRAVYDSNVIPDHDTVTIKTRRGFELTGSDNHRIRRSDGSWVRLDELDIGARIAVAGGNGVWPTEYATGDWKIPRHITLHDVADEADVSVWTVMRYRDVGRARRADAIETALSEYDGENQRIAQRNEIDVPAEVTEPLGRFLGLLVGDGHVSANSRHVGFTTASDQHALEFATLARDLFDVEPTVEVQGSRWRVYIYSENLKDLLVEAFDLPEGRAAPRKSIPEKILRSPKSVVAAFVRGLVDADGYAGDQGVILSTSSEELSKKVQLLLTNFGILSRRRKQTDGCYHVHVTGAFARTFAEEIGFGYSEKAARLREYLDDRSWFESRSWTDEVVEIEVGSGDVYDVSVEETHRYAGGGFLNHNSYWESIMMGEEAFAGDDEFVQYAEHMALVLGSPGLNPYKLGKELWEHVEAVACRREVAERLLRVAGIDVRNFHDAVDFDRVRELLEPEPPLDSITPETVADLRDLDASKVDRAALDRALSGDLDVEAQPWRVLSNVGLAERHFALTKPGNRGFLESIGRDELDRYARYRFDEDRYGSVEAAIADVDYEAGWDRMFEVRESHNDVTFLSEFLTTEFVRDGGYFTYEHSYAADGNVVASTDPADVKKKLLLQFTNFGKPRIEAADGNYENRNELLLVHRYNGIELDVDQAADTLERVFDLWGRPVNLKTIVKSVDEAALKTARRRRREPEFEERGKLLRYDGHEFTMEDLPWSDVEDIAASDLDYSTKPDDWLG